MKQDLALIEQFLDALWLERNLAENTLSAYRRDLTMLVEWLHHRGLSLASVGSDDHQRPHMVLPHQTRGLENGAVFPDHNDFAIAEFTD